MTNNKQIIDTPIQYFLDNVCKHDDIVNKYKQNFDRMSTSHPKYRYNWRVNFFDKHRYMNWILYTFFEDCKNKKDNTLVQNDVFQKDFTVYDIGCYDSFLVSLLREAGIEAYGYDDNDWDEMFALLNTKNHVNTTHSDIDVCVVLNYAHNFTPDALFSFVERKCKKMPEVLFFDFDKSVSHIHQHLYYETEVIQKYGFKVVNFSDYSERELFIWQNQ